MAVVIGVLMALGIAGIGRVTGMDRDRAVYPVILITIASYYVLFAVMGDSDERFVPELGVALIFAICALIGYQTSLWFVVIALAAHGVFDVVHSSWMATDHVPRWWPGFCLGIDVMLAVTLGLLLLSGKLKARKCH